MSQRTLRNLLLVGIAAMVVAVVCLILLHNLVPPRETRDTGDFIWEDMLARSSEVPAEAAASEPSADLAALEAVTPSPEPTPEATPEAAPEASVQAAPSPPVMLEGGLIPYDARWFTVTSEPVEEAGWAKVIRGSKPGQTLRFQNISWEMDVRDAEDVHGTLNGTPLTDESTVGTGTLVELFDAEGTSVLDTAIVVIPGDVNGDGIVDGTDVALIEAAAETPGSLAGVYLLAGDLDESGAVDARDAAAAAELAGG